MVEIHNKPKYAATVGFFDGVHTGHLSLIKQLIKAAHNRGLESMVLTFPQHPRQVLNSDYKPLLLTSPEDKICKLRKSGVDRCEQIDFTLELSLMTAKEFMSKILRDMFGVKCLILGHDHHFGHDGLKNLEDYVILGQDNGIEVIRADTHFFDNKAVSSSRIRRELQKGDVERASSMLGYSYSIRGKVVHGSKNGRKIGFPTANLGPYCELMQIPANGVYAAIATVGNEQFYSMLNIGVRPTFNNDKSRTIEAHLFDFDRDIYGCDLELCFIKYIRAEHKFNSPLLLKEQLKLDSEIAINTLEIYKRESLSI